MAAFLDALDANEVTRLDHAGYRHQSRARAKRTNVGRDDMDTAALESDEEVDEAAMAALLADLECRWQSQWSLPMPIRRAVWCLVGRVSCRNLIQRMTATQKMRTESLGVRVPQMWQADGVMTRVRRCVRWRSTLMNVDSASDDIHQQPFIFISSFHFSFSSVAESPVSTAGQPAK